MRSPAAMRDRLRAVVHQDHPHLAAVVAVDHAGQGVDAVAHGEAAARPDEADVAGRDLEVQAGGRRPRARPGRVTASAGAQVGAGGASGAYSGRAPRPVDLHHAARPSCIIAGGPWTPVEPASALANGGLSQCKVHRCSGRQPLRPRPRRAAIALSAAWASPPTAPRRSTAGSTSGASAPSAEMTDLPQGLRETPGRRLRRCAGRRWSSARHSRDGTVKYLFRLDDGATVESVYIPEERRRTICISTQAGCPLKCAFCLTGISGYKRNLEAVGDPRPGGHGHGGGAPDDNGPGTSSSWGWASRCSTTRPRWPRCACSWIPRGSRSRPGSSPCPPSASCPPSRS